LNPRNRGCKGRIGFGCRLRCHSLARRLPPGAKRRHAPLPKQHVSTATRTAARASHEDYGAGTCTDTIGSIFVLKSEPMSGLWFGKKARPAIDLHHRWHVRGGRIFWEPFAPANAREWEERIHALDEYANQKRRTGAFMVLSKTSQTRATFSLPAIVACALRDEACEHCYALKGWYRLDLSHQVDRVLRLEHLQRLISEHRLPTWIDWAGDELNALPPDEPLPPSLRGQGLPDAWCRGERIRYMRWHDSGDLFHGEYALAILKVCEATPQVAHWLPTRMGHLVSSMVQKGAVIPNNLSILVSVQQGGALEQFQIQAVRQVLKAQPHARIGLSYFVTGPAKRTVDMRMIEDQFGRGAVICPALTELEPEDRKCAGCRRCWAAHIDTPIIYPKS
jgi:hypothetical protein